MIIASFNVKLALHKLNLAFFPQQSILILQTYSVYVEMAIIIVTDILEVSGPYYSPTISKGR